MTKLLPALTLIGLSFILSSCANGNYGGGRGNSFGLPPGQVQKATGYNPASGKFKSDNGNGKYKNKKNKKR